MTAVFDSFEGGDANDNCVESAVVEVLRVANGQRSVPFDVVAAAADANAVPATRWAEFLDALEEAGVCVEMPDDSDDAPNLDAPAPASNGLGLFIRRSRHEVLSAEQEVELGRRVSAGQQAAAALTDDRWTDEDRRELGRIVHDGREAHRAFFESNVRLVINIATRYQRRGLELDDLIQEGFFGLNRAVEKFDYTKGFKFSTYATWWVRQSVTRAIANQGRAIRLPVHVHEQIRAARKKERELQRELGRRPTKAEVAGALGSTPGEVAELFRLEKGVISLNVPIGDGAAELADFVPDAGSSVEEAAMRASDVAAIRAMVAGLDERERLIITMRFGLDGELPRTLEQIGQVLNLTRERIRQIEVRVLSKLRHPARRLAKLIDGYISDATEDSA